MSLFGILSGKGICTLIMGTVNQGGVAICVSEKLDLEITDIDIDRDEEGRWIKGKIKWNNEIISVASVYAPNDSYARALFFDNLCDRIEDSNYIIGGDFNCNLDNDIATDPSKIIMHNVLNEKYIIDVWRTVQPTEPGYTHFHKVTKKPSRIDFFFIPSNLISNVNDISVYKHGLSDHNILNIKINDPHTCHGNGRWICNDSLLKEDDCISRITIFGNTGVSRKITISLYLNGEKLVNSELKKIIQGYGKEKARKHKHKQMHLQEHYNALISDPHKADINAIKDIETEL